MSAFRRAIFESPMADLVWSLMPCSRTLTLYCERAPAIERRTFEGSARRWLPMGTHLCLSHSRARVPVMLRQTPWDPTHAFPMEPHPCSARRFLTHKGARREEGDYTVAS